LVTKPKVFICYMHEDTLKARDLYRFLCEAGADPWLDKEKLQPGDLWQPEIEKAVRQAAAFVVLLRPGFDDIGFRQQEIRWALEALGKHPPGRAFIIPYVVEPCNIPEWCGPIHVADHATRRTERNELLRAIEKHCQVMLTGESLDPRLEAILRAVTDDQVQLLNSLGGAGSPACPLQNENPTWYASILLRPTKSRIDMGSGPRDVFVPIYFACFRREKVFATSSWTQTPQLLADPLNVRDCCSGLPIRWHSEAAAWKENPVTRGLIIARVGKGGRLKHLILNDVRRARFSMESNLIQETYATDTPTQDWRKAVGWMLLDDRSNRIHMSQSIETEILVPIYDPSSQHSPTGRDVLGVANFEWEQPHPLARAQEIGRYLSESLQDTRFFAISMLTCFILAQAIPTHG